MRRYGGPGGRLAGGLEGAAAALVYGGTRSFFGNRAAAVVIATAAASGAKPTAAQIVAAEKQVYAVEQPAITAWQIPAVGVALWLLGEGLTAWTGETAYAEAGEGLGQPATADFGEQIFAFIRRKQLNVTPAATRNFVGSTRAQRGGGPAANGASAGGGRIAAGYDEVDLAAD
jgi:hypothetical protein